ncbi:high affinity potassium transporter [Kluyveromyces marxianus]|nr:high affinity potassium transporter [Kluyveromyces marxianus]
MSTREGEYSSKYMVEEEDNSGVDSASAAPMETDIENYAEYSEKRPSKKATIASVAFLGYSSLGSIYGDIATSPLYTVPSIFSGSNLDVTENNLMGVVSCIFWLFTITVIVKYTSLVLVYGPNDGEGGQIALYCKIAKCLRNGPVDQLMLQNKTQSEDQLLLSRYETTNSQTTSIFKHESSWLQNKSFRKWVGRVTLILCFLGCSMVISDGLLTPTTSVLSAMEGITVAVPSFHGKTMPTSVAILIVLFLAQVMGIGKITMLFSPIVALWFIVLLVIGGINIAAAPRIFKALNPVEAINLLRRQGKINIMGDVMLSITGVEAMFADVGHFSPLSVQLSLLLVVYPSLMICYLGQGAYLIKHPEQMSNVFYESIPGKSGQGFYWFVFVLAILATIIASQALILGVSSISKQLIAVGFLPKLKVIHKSASHSGRIFIPVVNFLLMIGVLVCCVGFKTSARVTAAYGLTVSMDLFITSLFMSIMFVCVQKFHVGIAVLFLCVFGSLECCLIGANLLKVPHGAWVPLMVSGALFIFLLVWRWCYTMKANREARDRISLTKLLQDCQQQITYSSNITGAGISQRIQEEDEGDDDDDNDDDDDDVDEDAVANTQNTPDVRFSQPPQRRSSNKLDSTRPVIARPGSTHHVGSLDKIPRSNYVGIMFTDLATLLKHPASVPRLYKDLTKSFGAISRVFAFVGVHICNEPYVENEDRILVQKMQQDGFYRCIVRLGFMEAASDDEKKIEQLVSVLSMEEGINLHTIPVVEICSADQIIGKTLTEASIWKKSLYIARKFVIEYIYAPIYYSTERTNKEEENVVYFGKTVVI